MARAKRSAGYIETTWRGRPLFRCGQCTASRSSRKDIEDHLRDRHGIAPKAAKPKPAPEEAEA